jgi:hypothetical protein
MLHKDYESKGSVEKIIRKLLIVRLKGLGAKTN